MVIASVVTTRPESDQVCHFFPCRKNKKNVFLVLSHKKGEGAEGLRPKFS